MSLRSRTRRPSSPCSPHESLFLGATRGRRRFASVGLSIARVCPVHVGSRVTRACVRVLVHVAREEVVVGALVDEDLAERRVARRAFAHEQRRVVGCAGVARAEVALEGLATDGERCVFRESTRVTRFRFQTPSIWTAVRSNALFAVYVGSSERSRSYTRASRLVSHHSQNPTEFSTVVGRCRSTLRPHGDCEGLQMGANADTDRHSSGSLSAIVRAPCPPIE